MLFRTDRNRNPVAFTTDLAKQAKLKLNVDYRQGDPFNEGFHTAYLIGDPVDITIRVIDKLGFYTKDGSLRWSYLGLPYGLWKSFDYHSKTAVIGWMYKNEGGIEMKGLFQ